IGPLTVKVPAGNSMVEPSATLSSAARSCSSTSVPGSIVTVDGSVSRGSVVCGTVTISGGPSGGPSPRNAATIALPTSLVASRFEIPSSRLCCSLSTGQPWSAAVGAIATTLSCTACTSGGGSSAFHSSADRPWYWSM